MSVVIGVGCYFLVSYFRRINLEQFNSAISKKKAADAKIRSGDDLSQSLLHA